MSRTKRTWILVAMVCFATVVAATAFAEEPTEETSAPAIRPIETFTCRFNEGKTMDDLKRVTADWNAWMDAEQVDTYWANNLVPLYYSAEIDFDVLWVGGWKDGVTMAAGMDFWITNGGEHQKAYEEVLDCDAHGNFAVLEVKPLSGPMQSGPTRFSNCTVQEGKSVTEAIDALHKWVAYRGEQGIDAGHFVLFPAFGHRSDAEYDFKWVRVSTYETLGRAYDQTSMGGGYQKYEEFVGGVMDCDSPRVYHRTPVRKVEFGD